MPYISFQGGGSQFPAGLGAFTPLNPSSYFDVHPYNILPYYKSPWASIGQGLASGLAMGEELQKMPAIQAETQAAKTAANAQTQNIQQEQQMPLVNPDTGEPNRGIAINSQGQRSYTGANVQTPTQVATGYRESAAALAAAQAEAQQKAYEAKRAGVQSVPISDLLKNGGKVPDLQVDPGVQSIIRRADQIEGLGPPNGNTDFNNPGTNIIPKGPKSPNAPAGQVIGNVVPNSTAAGADTTNSGGNSVPGSGLTPISNPLTSPVPGASPHGPAVNTPGTGIVPASPNQIPNVPGKPDPAAGQLNTQGVLPPDEVNKWYKMNYDSSAKGAKWSPATQTYTIKTADGETHVSPQQVFQNLGHYTPPSNFTSEVDAYTKNYALHQIADKVGSQMYSPGSGIVPPVPVSGGARPNPMLAPSGNAPLPSPTQQNENPWQMQIVRPQGVSQADQQQNNGLIPVSNPAPKPGAVPRAQLVSTPSPTPAPISGAKGNTTAGTDEDSQYTVTADGLTYDTKTGDYIEPFSGRRGQPVPNGDKYDWYFNGMLGGPHATTPNFGAQQIENQNGILLKPSPDGRPAWKPDEITIARQSPEGQVRIQNEVAERTYEAATDKVPDTVSKELDTGRNLIQSGLEVQNALKAMKNDPSAYNWWHQLLGEWGDKFWDTPVTGDAIRSVNQKLGIGDSAKMPPAVAQLNSAFEHYVNVLPHEMFGRVNQQELGLVRKIVGDPNDQNSSFASRFADDLVRRQEDYVHGVNQALSNRYRITRDDVNFAAKQRQSPILQGYLDSINRAQQSQTLPNWPMYQNSGAQPSPLPSPRRTPQGGPTPSVTPSVSPAATTGQSNQGGGNAVPINGVNDPAYKNAAKGSTLSYNGQVFIKQ